MDASDVKECRGPGKGFRFFFWLASAWALAGPGLASAAEPPLRLMLDRAPVTLNPRRAGDAMGQRLGALIFRSLTRIDADLNPQPDLASGWQIIDGGKTWRFEIRSGLVDHSGSPITAPKVAQCLEGYRVGKPTSVFKSSFPGWNSTEAKSDAVLIHLDKPSPYLARNLSLLRYFRVEGTDQPCTEPAPGQKLIASGAYRPEPWDPAPESELGLVPVEPLAQGRRALQITFVADDNARAIKLIHGEVDATQSVLSLAKVRWIQKNYPDRFELLERDGVIVSYLAMNLRDPVLAHKEVRQAIAEAIDREDIVRNKLLGFCTLAGSLLSPHLAESKSHTFHYDPVHAEKLLDQAGFPRPKPGAMRFDLHYRTTPVREGFENALMFQDMLARVGIRVIIDSMEPAVFLASIKKGAFQLYSSRWVGISDGSILYRTLHSGQPDNRVGYKSAEMDELLDRGGLADLQRAQTLMAEDLPYFPLWYWDNQVILKKGLHGLERGSISLSGSYEPLTHLH